MQMRVFSVNRSFLVPGQAMESERWRKMLQSPHFKTHCVVVAVDEAHCIS